MKRAILVVVAFAAVTILLTWFWTEWGRLHYGNFLKLIAPPIYDAIGFDGSRVGAYRQRYINFVPFLGLVLVTPGILLRRRLLGLIGGLVTLSAGHLALNLTERVHRGAHLPFVPSLVSDALPFIVWIIVAYPVISQWFSASLGEQLNPTSENPGSASPSESAD